VLSQVQNGEEKVIAFASQVLSKAERRYSVTRLELLAVVTYIKYFRQFLLGMHFILRIDHGSLQWIQGIKEPEGQVARWLERLQEYDFEVCHRKGSQHGNADALSRYPLPQLVVETSSTTTVVASVTSPMLTERTADELTMLQQRDEDIGPILDAVKKKQRPSSNVQGRSRTFRSLLQQWNQLYAEEALLYRRFVDTEGKEKWAQLVAPEVLRKEILSSLHDGIAAGNLREEKTLGKLRQIFYWPGYTVDVRTWCQTCATCAARKSPAPRNKATLESIHPGYPLHTDSGYGSAWPLTRKLK